jgi:DNA topoisomerase-3
MKTAIIAEKPSVAREIAQIVGAKTKEDGFMTGGGYMVTWAFGHLVGLAMPEDYGFSRFVRDNLPIIPENFVLKPRQIREGKEYKPDSGALRQLKTIKHVFENCDKIIVATDAGREGELIFRYIYSHLNCQTPFERLWISSLTDKAVKEGLQNLKNGSTAKPKHFEKLQLSPPPEQNQSTADIIGGLLDLPLPTSDYDADEAELLRQTMKNKMRRCGMKW